MKAFPLGGEPRVYSCSPCAKGGSSKSREQSLGHFATSPVYVAGSAEGRDEGEGNKDVFPHEPKGARVERRAPPLQVSSFLRCNVRQGKSSAPDPQNIIRRAVQKTAQFGKRGERGLRPARAVLRDRCRAYADRLCDLPLFPAALFNFPPQIFGDMFVQSAFHASIILSIA